MNEDLVAVGRAQLLAALCENLDDEAEYGSGDRVWADRLEIRIAEPDLQKLLHRWLNVPDSGQNLMCSCGIRHPLDVEL